MDPEEAALEKELMEYMHQETHALKETHFQFDGQTGFYRGKVRDVYYFGSRMAMVATDRISAFDHILPQAIPYKGQVLTLIAKQFLEDTADLVPNWLEEVPHPQVAIGMRCQPYAVEMVIRGYLAGHAWREYQAGRRTICGVAMPEGMQENQRFPEPIITPTTKAQEGHDLDISREEILAQGIVPQAEYEQLEAYTRALFARGAALAEKNGLILVDTKYEFGKDDAGQIRLIDEVHTPDSSRYFYADTYQELLEQRAPQRQLSKEFVREWLMANGFRGKEGQAIPDMPESFVQLVSDRYIELYDRITGEPFQRKPQDTLEQDVQDAIATAMAKYR
jgi:phosphoribosylaminoimidazole-succinocarboxamide synthase